MSEIDPVNATSRDVSRRLFVGISAGAALAAGSVATSLAQGTQLGQTHPPLVPEDDPAIEQRYVLVATPTKQIRAYLAAPKNAGPSTPGVVVIMHAWGVDTSIRDVCRRLAKEGYISIAPDLYDRFGAPSGDGVSDFKVFSPYIGKVVDSQADDDIRRAAETIRTTYHSTARIGVMGFCMGGGITLRQAVDNANIFSAAAVFYGKVRYATGGSPGSEEGIATTMALAYSDEIKIPVMGSFGERDTGILAADVRALQKQLTVPNEIKFYPEAGHAFFDDQRSAYVASAATDAWSRLLAFFGKYLKGKAS